MSVVSSADQKSLADPNLISIICTDGMVHLKKETAMASITIKDIMEDFGDSKVEIQYTETPTAVVTSLFQFSKLLADHAPIVVPSKEPVDPTKVPAEDQVDPKSAPLADWEKEFFNNLTKNDTDLLGLFNLLLAANYFSMELPLHRAAVKVAELIKGKDPEQIRATFQVPPEVVAAMGVRAGAK